jgi:hypothetical protein
MKKSMKFKRYDEGGEVADKEAGLKASKGEDVGFFQRLRMGNIDDPNSEAYKRFGAGRGRSERIPVVDMKPSDETSRKEPAITPYRPSEETMKRNTSGMDIQDESGMINKRLKRNPETGDLYDTEVTAPSVKPNASKPMGKREVGESVSGKPTVRNKVTAPSLGNDDYGFNTSEASTPPDVKLKPASEAPTKTSSSRVPTSEQAAANRAAAMEKVKGMGSSIADYFSTYETPAERKSKERKEKAAKGYASGGSVSSASRRADGIATKGKTRGRMC